MSERHHHGRKSVARHVIDRSSGQEGFYTYGALRDVLGREARNASEDAFLVCCAIGQSVSSGRTALQLKTSRSRGARSSAFKLGDRLKREQSSAIPDTGAHGRESYRLKRLTSGQ
jgi:hypothetical protein